MKKLKMDLHVHTPASKCYLGENSDEQYLCILKKAIKGKIDILAITDHNTISGYRRLIEIQKKLKTERDTLLPYKDTSGKIAHRLNEIEDNLALYDQVWIISGVEITLNPGIHMIVLSSKKETEELSLLLDEVGYPIDKRGADSDFVPNMDVKTFLNSTYLKNKIVIAPHVDSGKGIYNDLNGMYRADIFKNPNIHAISCNNAKQLEIIQGLVKNDPHYKREKPWAYINASDAHSVEAVGSRISFVSINGKRFDALREIFVDSTEKISDVENQQVADLIEKLIKNQKAMLLKELLDDEYEMAKVMCACFNSGYHSVIIGVTKEKELIGSSIMVERMKELAHNIDDYLVNINNTSTGLLTENLGNGRHVYILLVRKTTTKLCYTKAKDEVFIYSKKIKKASVFEIEKIVESKLLLELERFQKYTEDSIIQIQNTVKTLQQPITRYKMAISIENNSELLCDLVDVDVVDASTYMDKWKELNMRYGEVGGKLFFAENNAIRLDNAVLRYTCPNTKLDIFSDNEKKSMKKISQECIVITKEGGMYLISDFENECYIESNDEFIVIYLSQEFLVKYSVYSVMAWLKSSAFIWYMLKRAGTLDIFNPEIFKQIVIPKVAAMESGSETERIVKEIIQTEKQFLLKVKEMYEKNSEDEINLLVDDHNDRITVLSKQIDDIFFNAVGCIDIQRKIISEDIDAAQIYNYLV